MFNVFGILSSVNFAQLASVPLKRLDAMRNLEANHDFLENKWFVITGLSLIIMLSLVLYLTRRYRLQQEVKRMNDLFKERAQSAALDPEENELLLKIANLSGLKKVSSIFTMPAAFDKGSAQLMQELFSKGTDFNDRKNLNQNLNSLKYKLGFSKAKLSSSIRSAASKSLSSRQIPVGKKVTFSAKTREGFIKIEGIVTATNDMEFAVRSESQIDVSPGQIFKVHYRYGASTWEFTSVVLIVKELQIVMNHSDNIRFINRRRFLRVTVDKQAVIAPFESSMAKRDSVMMSPTFTSARVVELSGPGLKVETTIEFEIGQRILIVFELDEQTFIQDIAEVRRVSCKEGLYTVGVELIGLNDSSVNKLVRATNTAALMQNKVLEEQLQMEQEMMEAAK